MQEHIRLNEADQQMGVTRWTVRRWSQNRHYDCPPIIPLSKNASVLDLCEWEAFKRRLLRGEGCRCGGYAACGKQVAA